MIETKVKECRKKHKKISVVIYNGDTKVPYTKHKYDNYASVFIDTEVFPVKVIFEL